MNKQEKAAARLDELLTYERKLWQAGVKYIAGVDEVGRGPLAGPVLVGAVILDPATADLLLGVDDSKKLSAKRRDELCQIIKQNCVCWALGWQNCRLIDQDGIACSIQKSLAMALRRLEVAPQHLLIDAFAAPNIAIPQTVIVKGDAKSLSIAAASIVAKCARDEMMCRLDTAYPQYGLAVHKGYGTAAHIDAIRQYGRSAQHRRSFLIKGVDR